MKALNHTYTDTDALNAFIAKSGIRDTENMLVQVFSGICDEAFAGTLAKEIKKALPCSRLIGTTTAGEICEGNMSEKQAVISFSLFEKTKIRSGLYANVGEEACAKQIVGDLVGNDTKALILFSDGLQSNGEEILRHITHLSPGLIVAGGRAGDYHRFDKTFVFDENTVLQNGFAAASLSGDDLRVYNDYLLNWETIGEEMTVTDAEKNRLVSINGRGASEIYKKYLGEEISASLPESGVEFPLIMRRGGVEVARAPIAKLEDGSLLFGGNINEGEKVKFGFGNLEMIRERSFSDYGDFKAVPVEATYIYSCSARKALLGNGLEAEFDLLQRLAPTAGFFTYGEFFHSQQLNELLNITTTFLSVSETDAVSPRPQSSAAKASPDRTLKALTHLVSVTSAELQESNRSLREKVRENEKIRNSLNEGQRIAEFGIWERDIKTGSFWCSEGVYRIFGLKPQGYNASYEGFERHIHPEDRKLVDDAIEGTLNNKEPYLVIHRIIRSDNGEVRYVKEQGEVECDENGSPVLMKGTVQNITELMQTQLELETYKNSLEEQVKEEIEKRRQQEAMLMQQSRLAGMGEMIGNIAHQWRQPLNALALMMVNIKFTYEFGQFDEAFLDKTYEKSNRLIQKMSTTIEDFTNFFKPDRKKELFDLNDVVKDALSLLEASLKDCNIALELDLAEDVFVEGYKNELSQVVLNIINNAKDALVDHKIEEGRIGIKSFCENNRAGVVIEDNGGGIPKEISEKIFDPYFTTKEQGKGTGIGLYMSKIIIEEHMQGSIRFENGDCGAKFMFFLKKADGSGV